MMTEITTPVAQLPPYLCVLDQKIERNIKHIRDEPKRRRRAYASAVFNIRNMSLA